MNRPSLRFSCFLALAVLAAGCSVLSPRKDPTRFYVLTQSASQPGTASRSNTLVLSVEIAGYLQNLALVERIAPNQLSYYPFDHWAQPFVDGFSQTLRANLVAESGRPVAIATQSYVVRDAQRVEIHLRRFDVLPGQRVEVMATWLVRDGLGAEPVHRGEFRKEAAFVMEAGTLQPAVAAFSGLVDELTRAILAGLH